MLNAILTSPALGIVGALGLLWFISAVEVRTKGPKL